jgi:hypothetical protein
MGQWSDPSLVGCIPYKGALVLLLALQLAETMALVRVPPTVLPSGESRDVSLDRVTIRPSALPKGAELVLAWARLIHVSLAQLMALWLAQVTAPATALMSAHVSAHAMVEE